MSREVETYPLNVVADPAFVPKLIEVLGKKVKEEPLAKVNEAWVHFGRGHVIFKFAGDNRRHAMTPETAQSFANALLRCAKGAATSEGTDEY